MKPVRKSSLVAEAEKELREAIASGQFGAALPGFRTLAKVLGVSPPTVAEAVKILVAEGIVVPGGVKRRMRLVLPVEGSPAGGERVTKVLWFVTSDSFENADRSSMKAFALLQQSLSGIGWQVRHRVMSYGHSENRAAQWDRMVEAETPDALVVWTGRPALGGWAVSRGLRVLFMGGAREDLPVPVFAVRSPDMVDRALRELAARGHRRFCLPMCNRAAGTVRTIRAVASKCLRSHGLRGKEHVPVSAYEGGHVIEAMARQALSERSPTGWIFFDWREFLAASCVFRDQGLAIPGDISVVLLSWDPAMDWFRPAVAHFRHPLDRMVKAVAEWVLEGDGGTGTRYFAPEWVPGASLGQAPG